MTNDNVMERVLFHLHQRVCHFGLQQTSSRYRRLVELVLLVLAILNFGALILLHRSFVYRQSFANCASKCLQQIPNFDPQADITHLVILPSSSTHDNTATTSSTVLWKTARNHHDRSSGISTCSAPVKDDTTCAISSSHADGKTENSTISYCPTNSEIYLSYSSTKGYLMLPPDHNLLQEHVRIQYVLASPQDPNCFGEPFLQSLVWDMGIGSPDTIIWNWLLALEQPGYFVYNHRNYRLTELRLPTTTKSNISTSSWFRLPLSKLNVIIQTSFLYFFCTTLVSFTLLQTQERMLEFTQELSRRVHLSLPLSDLITTHVVQNLVFVPIMVGMMFFLIEFYNGDKFLAFLVLSIVWCVEVFSVISLRSSQGITFFPRIFFLLFCLFHIYHFANPYAFGYTALVVVGCFMSHSMVFFWHRYELPALAYGLVTVDRPRMHMSEALLYADPSFHSPQRVATNNRNTDQVPTVIQPHTPTHNQRPQQQENHSHHDDHPMGSSHHHASFSTTSSRNTSGLFRQNNDDDDDDESYVYFMEGEVVVHRQRRTNPSAENEASSTEEVSTTATTTTPHPNPQAATDERVGLDISENYNSNQPEYSDESGGLQAILEVRLTPRHRNAEPRQNRSTALPTFPELPSH